MENSDIEIVSSFYTRYTIFGDRLDSRCDFVNLCGGRSVHGKTAYRLKPVAIDSNFITLGMEQSLTAFQVLRYAGSPRRASCLPRRACPQADHQFNQAIDVLHVHPVLSCSPSMPYSNQFPQRGQSISSSTANILWVSTTRSRGRGQPRCWAERQRPVRGVGGRRAAAARMKHVGRRVLLHP